MTDESRARQEAISKNQKILDFTISKRIDHHITYGEDADYLEFDVTKDEKDIIDVTFVNELLVLGATLHHFVSTSRGSKLAVILRLPK